VKIKLLCTGGADGIPGFFSVDRVSQYARKHGGKDIRTRSAALIDGLLKIDLPPDTLHQVTANRLNPLDWTALLFTHSHEDHFAPSEIQYALYPFTPLEQLPYQIMGNKTIGHAIAKRYPDWPIDFVKFSAFHTCQHAKYRITPFPAHHVPSEECFNFLIEADRTLIYATDTGIWDEPSFEFLAGKKADCLIIECTEGFANSDFDGHLNLKELESVLNRLKSQDSLSDSAIIKTTHHAHTGEGTHAELEQALEYMGVTPGYDGELITF
jgi:phosphoribosyl 1,2-cyclic phosphate phosphodiesterase